MKWEMRLIREIRLAMSSSQVYENHELLSGYFNRSSLHARPFLLRCSKLLLCGALSSSRLFPLLVNNSLKGCTRKRHSHGLKLEMILIV